MDIREQLVRDEGLRLKPYVDTVGKMTIGVGHNLTDKGITEEQAYLLLDADIAEVQQALAGFAWFSQLDSVRQGAMLNMAFNLGVSGLLHFPNMISALSRGDWPTASQEMMNSLWATQVGQRAIRLSQQVLVGVWQ